MREAVLLDFSLSVKAAPHECVIRTGNTLFSPLNASKITASDKVYLTYLTWRQTLWTPIRLLL